MLVLVFFLPQADEKEKEFSGEEEESEQEPAQGAAPVGPAPVPADFEPCCSKTCGCATERPPPERKEDCRERKDRKEKRSKGSETARQPGPP